MIRTGFVMKLLGNDQEYRVAIYIKHKGYGLSVIAKLKETKIKRNLYYEIKDKIVEEVVQYGKIYKSSKKTKIYGLNNTHEMRNILVELLKERVSLHKDKFISPTLHKELTGLEVKKNGRVEHSDLSHDDAISSYLMALYVWYHGKNLRELFGIEKAEIRTEDSVDDILELESGPKSMIDMSKTLIGINNAQNDKNTMKLEMDLQQLQKGQGIMFSDFKKQQRKKEEEHLRFLLNQKKTREAYARYYGIPVQAVDTDIGKGSYDEASFNLPNSLFTDFNKDKEELDHSSIYLNLPQNEYDRSQYQYYDEDESIH